MKAFKIILISLALALLTLAATAQERLVQVRTDIELLAKTTPGLNEQAEITMSGVSIQEFVRTLGNAHRLNINIDPTIGATVVNNFANARVADILVFLCKEYDLNLEVIGSIMSFTQYDAPEPVAVAKPAKKLGISYSDQTDFLSLDLKKDTLAKVVAGITDISLKNVIIDQGLENEEVSCFIKNRPFANALEMMAFSNGLKVEPAGENVFRIVKDAPEPVATTNTSTNRNNRGNQGGQNNNKQLPKGGQFTVTVGTDDLISVDAVDVPITDVVQAVSAELLKNYFLFSQPQGNTTLYIENATYDEFMQYLLNGTEFTYKIEDEVYLIGERKLERLRSTEMVQLQNRTVESISEFIPTELKAGVEIKEFTELNSLVLSGSHPRINEIKRFVREIDKVVPVVLIDVIIVDYQTGHNMDLGVSLGTGPSDTQTGVQLSPGVNATINANAINSLINSFNGFGILNLGRVGPDFYMSLEALENNNILKKRSTPKLATLNGHEASMSLGNTEYYAENTQNVLGSINTTVTQSQVFKPLNADFSINIKPIVSGDDQVTMSITVSKSEFGARTVENGPPSSSNLTFESVMRVRNEEMILLGGLEEREKNNTTSGLPWLSRVPVLKWIFGKETRSKSKRKLNIFIKPTILY